MAQTGGFFSGAAPSPTGSMGGGAIGSGGGMMLTPAMSRPQPPQNQQMIPGQQNNQPRPQPMGAAPAPAQGGMSMGPAQGGGMDYGRPQWGGAGGGGQAIGGMMPPRQGDYGGGMDYGQAQRAKEMMFKANGGQPPASPSGGMQEFTHQMGMPPQGQQAQLGNLMNRMQNPGQGGVGTPWNAQPQGGDQYQLQNMKGAAPGGAPPPQQAPAFGAQNSARQGFGGGRSQMISALRRPV